MLVTQKVAGIGGALTSHIRSKGGRRILLSLGVVVASMVGYMTAAWVPSLVVFIVELPLTASRQEMIPMVCWYVPSSPCWVSCLQNTRSCLRPFSRVLEGQLYPQMSQQLTGCVMQALLQKALGKQLKVEQRIVSLEQQLASAREDLATARAEVEVADFDTKAANATYAEVVTRNLVRAAPDGGGNGQGDGDDASSDVPDDAVDMDVDIHEAKAGLFDSLPPEKRPLFNLYFGVGSNKHKGGSEFAPPEFLETVGSLAAILQAAGGQAQG